VLDTRGYPPTGVVTTVFAMLLDREVPNHLGQIPLVQVPEQPMAPFLASGWAVGGSGEAGLPKVAVIADGRCMSWVEVAIMWVEAAGWPIVGSPSARANGNMASIRVPGLERPLTFTGMRVLRPGGQSYFCRGVPRTHPVEPTRKQLAEGRDARLEAAWNLVR